MLEKSRHVACGASPSFSEYAMASSTYSERTMQVLCLPAIVATSRSSTAKLSEIYSAWPEVANLFGKITQKTALYESG
jgi:hypothetical protein